MRIFPLLALAAAVGACASSGTQDDPNAPETCVVVDNTEGSESAGRVVLSSERRERISVGELTLGRSLRHCFRRRALGGRWQFLIYDQSVGAARAFGATGGPEASEYFYINPGDEVTWQVQRDRIVVRRNDTGT